MNRTTALLTAVTLLAAAATAQNATYRLFGDGCNGSPITTCLTLNDQNPTLQVASLPNEYAYPVINTTGMPIQITGFSIYTVTNTGLVETGNTGLIWDLSGPTATAHTRPDPTNVANGTITVGGTQGWYSTVITPPITVPAGVAFWFHVDAYSRIAPPQHTTTGGVGGPVANWYRRPSNNMVWTSSVSVARQIFRIHCQTPTPTVPTLSAMGTPQFGQTMMLHLDGGQPNGGAFLVFAFSNAQWMSFPTPVDLAMFGAPNCFNRTSTDDASFLLLDGNGRGTRSVSIPNLGQLLGFTFHNQAAVVQPGINALSLLVSNAGTGVVGN